MSESRNSYGWVIEGVATLALVVSNGLSIGGFPPFYKPIREEFVLLGAVDQSTPRHSSPTAQILFS